MLGEKLDPPSPITEKNRQQGFEVDDPKAFPMEEVSNTGWSSSPNHGNTITTWREDKYQEFLFAIF
jgi:hypothetical protein